MACIALGGPTGAFDIPGTRHARASLIVNRYTVEYHLYGSALPVIRCCVACSPQLQSLCTWLRHYW